MTLTLRRSLSASALLAALIALTYVGSHAVPRWFPQIRLFSAKSLIGEPVPAAVADLPLVMVPAERDDGPIAILFSGNGGWWSIDESLAAAFRADGVTTYGWSSLAYFVERRSPDEVAADIGRVARLSPPNRDILLVGYSFGADIVATAYRRLDPAVQARVRVIALLSLSRTADYAMGILGPFAPKIATVAAIRDIGGPKILCVMGQEEGTRSACPLLDPGRVTVIERPGGHHFDGNYRPIAEDILRALHDSRHAEARIAFPARAAMMASPTRPIVR
jgi:type IV secretory pathway VirJ component